MGGLPKVQHGLQHGALFLKTKHIKSKNGENDAKPSIPRPHPGDLLSRMRSSS